MHDVFGSDQSNHHKHICNKKKNPKKKREIRNLRFDILKFFHLGQSLILLFGKELRKKYFGNIEGKEKYPG